MTTEAATIGLTHGGSEDTGLGHRGPESKSIVVPYGFWLFVLSDMVLFSALFATYAALVNATDGGPTTVTPARMNSDSLRRGGTSDHQCQGDTPICCASS